MADDGSAEGKAMAGGELPIQLQVDDSTGLATECRVSGGGGVVETPLQFGVVKHGCTYRIELRVCFVGRHTAPVSLHQPDPAHVAASVVKHSLQDMHATPEYWWTVRVALAAVRTSAGSASEKGMFKVECGPQTLVAAYSYSVLDPKNYERHQRSALPAARGATPRRAVHLVRATAEISSLGKLPKTTTYMPHNGKADGMLTYGEKLKWDYASSGINRGRMSTASLRALSSPRSTPAVRQRPPAGNPPSARGRPPRGRAVVARRTSSIGSAGSKSVGSTDAAGNDLSQSAAAHAKQEDSEPQSWFWPGNASASSDGGNSDRGDSGDGADGSLQKSTLERSEHGSYESPATSRTVSLERDPSQPGTAPASEADVVKQLQTKVKRFQEALAKQVNAKVKADKAVVELELKLSEERKLRIGAEAETRRLKHVAKKSHAQYPVPPSDSKSSENHDHKSRVKELIRAREHADIKWAIAHWAGRALGQQLSQAQAKTSSLETALQKLKHQMTALRSQVNLETRRADEERKRADEATAEAKQARQMAEMAHGTPTRPRSRARMRSTQSFAVGASPARQRRPSRTSSPKPNMDRRLSTESTASAAGSVVEVLNLESAEDQDLLVVSPSRTQGDAPPLLGRMLQPGQTGKPGGRSKPQKVKRARSASRSRGFGGSNSKMSRTATFAAPPSHQRPKSRGRRFTVQQGPAGGGNLSASMVARTSPAKSDDSRAAEPVLRSSTSSGGQRPETPGDSAVVRQLQQQVAALEFERDEQTEKLDRSSKMVQHFVKVCWRLAAQCAGQVVRRYSDTMESLELMRHVARLSQNEAAFDVQAARQEAREAKVALAGKDMEIGRLQTQVQLSVDSLAKVQQQQIELLSATEETRQHRVANSLFRWRLVTISASAAETKEKLNNLAKGFGSKWREGEIERARMKHEMETKIATLEARLEHQGRGGALAPGSGAPDSAVALRAELATARAEADALATSLTNAETELTHAGSRLLRERKHLREADRWCRLYNEFLVVMHGKDPIKDQIETLMRQNHDRLDILTLQLDYDQLVRDVAPAPATDTPTARSRVGRSAGRSQRTAGRLSSQARARSPRLPKL